MARSTYVYVVLDVLDPVAGFTMRHELIRYLRGRSHRHTLMQVWRLPDGGSPMGKRAPVRIDIAGLLSD